MVLMAMDVYDKCDTSIRGYLMWAIELNIYAAFCVYCWRHLVDVVLEQRTDIKEQAKRSKIGKPKYCSGNNEYNFCLCHMTSAKWLFFYSGTHPHHWGEK